MNLGRTVTLLIRRGFARLHELAATTEPTPAERERERRRQLYERQNPARMAIETLSYSRQPSQTEQAAAKPGPKNTPNLGSPPGMGEPPRL